MGNLNYRTAFDDPARSGIVGPAISLAQQLASGRTFGTIHLDRDFALHIARQRHYRVSAARRQVEAVDRPAGAPPMSTTSALPNWSQRKQSDQLV
jgi:hypothetical protein